MQSKSFFQITLEYLPTYPFLYWNPFKVLIKVWSDEFDIWHLSRVTNWNLRHWNGRWWWRNIWMIGGLDGNNYVTDIVTFVLRWVNVTLESAQICPVKVQLYVMSYITFSSIWYHCDCRIQYAAYYMSHIMWYIGYFTQLLSQLSLLHIINIQIDD